MAYSIEHHRDGYYVFVDMIAAPETINELERTLRVSEEVLRHMITRRDPRTAQKERETFAAAAAAAAAAPAPEPAAAEQAPVEQAPTEETAAAEVATEAAADETAAEEQATLPEGISPEEIVDVPPAIEEPSEA